MLFEYAFLDTTEAIKKNILTGLEFIIHLDKMVRSMDCMECLLIANAFK